MASAQKRRGINHRRQPMLTAEKAAQALLTLAQEIDPEGALATHAKFEEVPQTAEIAGVDEDLPTARAGPDQPAEIQGWHEGVLEQAAAHRAGDPEGDG